MWEPQTLATLRASTASTGITLPFTLFIYHEYMSFNIRYITLAAQKILDGKAIVTVDRIRWHSNSDIFDILGLKHCLAQGVEKYYKF
jgi:hypothetical protein